MNTASLEEYYEKKVLPKYSDVIDLSDIRWKDHGKVGLDAWAHYFDDSNGREYVLLYEDFPGSDYLSDGLTHDIIKCGKETSIHLTGNENKTKENIFGYFTLYAEKLSK